MLNTPHHTTPLLELLRNLGTIERREEFAMLAGTSRMYLYQLAGCYTRACRTDLALAITKASIVLNEKYQCGYIDMNTLATMCPVSRKKSNKKVPQTT